MCTLTASEVHKSNVKIITLHSNWGYLNNTNATYFLFTLHLLLFIYTLKPCDYTVEGHGSTA